MFYIVYNIIILICMENMIMYEDKIKNKEFSFDKEILIMDKRTSFWEEIKSFKDLYEDNKKKDFSEKLEFAKKEKVSLSKINPELNDIFSLFLFIAAFLALSIFEVKEYFAYVIIPISAMIIGKYYLPEKIKKIDEKKVEELTYNLKNNDFSYGFENEIADKNLISSFKEAYGENEIENIILEVIQEEENKNIDKLQLNMENKNNLEIKVKDLIKRANKVDIDNKNKEVARKMAKCI